MKPTTTHRAIVLVKEISKADYFLSVCPDYGIEAEVFTDPEAVLDLCRTDPPNLAVVDEELQTMSGLEFVNALVRIAWTISVIIAMDADEETVHDKAEGLGILGHIQNLEDAERLKSHLETFVNMMASLKRS